ncbi:unnamed protein product, partial [marine sediment metagenome]
MKKKFIILKKCPKLKPVFLVLVAALLSMSILSCKSTTKKPEWTAPSQFLEKLSEKEYPEVKAPAVAPVLKWDFSEKKVYEYDYKQKFRINRWGEDLREPKKWMLTIGKLLVKSQGNHTA